MINKSIFDRITIGIFFFFPCQVRIHTNWSKSSNASMCFNSKIAVCQEVGVSYCLLVQHLLQANSSAKCEHGSTLIPHWITLSWKVVYLLI